MSRHHRNSNFRKNNVRFSKIPHFKYFLTKEKFFPPFITERIMLSHILHQNFDSAKTDSKFIEFFELIAGSNINVL